jgi:hypothetical protein
MEDVLLTNDVAATVPEEVVSLMDEIDTACDGNRCDHAIAALWLMLLKVFVSQRECSVPEAVKHVQNLVKSTEFGTRDEAITALSPRH